MSCNSCRLLAALSLVVLVCIQSGCQAYPQLFAAKHAKNSCLDHPSKLQQYGSHGRLVLDSNVTVQLLEGNKAVNILCPGGQYTVKVTFPSARLALVTTSLATFKTATNSSCPNQLVTSSKRRVRNVTAVLSVACAASGRELDLKVTSASKKSSSLAFTHTMIPVDSFDGPRCTTVSKACVRTRPAQIVAGDAAGTSGTVFVPLTPSSADAGKSEAQGGAAEAQSKQAEEKPVYAFAPVLQDHTWLWQFLHSVLMLLSFCFLLPLGSLLARHRWIFGRDPLSSRVLRSWGPVHVITQIVGLLAAAAGVIIAILAFGWKDVPGQKLYTPHKWAGVGVMGMALVQGLFGILRPKKTARVRGCWNTLHHCWGRITIIGGMGNAVLGALLIHGYKKESYLHWLLPTCVLVGSIGIIALVLEAFRVQMQRTNRYNSRTGGMLPVLDGYKHSKKRPQGGAAKFTEGLPSSQRPESDDCNNNDTDVVDQTTQSPAVTHRTGPVKTSIRPPQLGTQE